nr:nucleosome assembly protein 1;2-like [Tanacetum cinerariifolium]
MYLEYMLTERALDEVEEEEEKEEEDDEDEDDNDEDLDDELVTRWLNNTFERQRMRKLGKKVYPKMKKSKRVVNQYNRPGCAGAKFQMWKKDPENPNQHITISWQNKDNIVVAKNAQRKCDEASNGCAGAELFERFKLIAKSDRSNAPYDPGGTGLISDETTREVKLFRRVMATLINGSQVDVPFDPGDFAPKAKLEDEFFFQEEENDAGK